MGLANSFFLLYLPPVPSLLTSSLPLFLSKKGLLRGALSWLLGSEGILRLAFSPIITVHEENESDSL